MPSPTRCPDLFLRPGYKFYGLNRGEHEGKKGIWYREWAPGAKVRPPARPLLLGAPAACWHCCCCCCCCCCCRCCEPFRRPELRLRCGAAALVEQPGQGPCRAPRHACRSAAPDAPACSPSRAPPHHSRQAVALIGEFNSWEPGPEHWAIKNDFGVWSLFLPDRPDGTPAIQHRCARLPARLRARARLAGGWEGSAAGWLERRPCTAGRPPAERAGGRAPSSSGGGSSGGSGGSGCRRRLASTPAPRRPSTRLSRAPTRAHAPPPARSTKVKTRLETAYGEWVERIPAWIKWATQVRAGGRQAAGPGSGPE